MPSATSPSRESSNGLSTQGLAPKGALRWNLNPPELVASAIRRGEGELADMGPFVAVTSPHTGRSPKDKFVIREATSENDVDWGTVNQPMTEAQFNLLITDVRGYLDA